MQVKFFVIIKKYFFLKNTFKVALQYLFNVLYHFNLVFNLKLNFKLNIDPKMHTLKTWKKFLRPGNNLKKMSGSPAFQIKYFCIIYKI